MATSAGLAWSLANGISQEQYDQNLADAYAKAQAQGLSDAQIESNMNQYGISAADVARALGVPVGDVQTRLEAATPTTPEEIAYNKAAMDELAQREAQWAAAQQKNVTDWAAQQKANEIAWSKQQQLNTTNWAAQQKANELAWAEQQRLNALKNQQQIAANQAAWAAQQKQNEAAWAAQQKANQLAATKQQTQTGPFANATQGFAQNFQNYQSIMPGAQYNPAVTGGASPYSLIMGQMQPVGNPYANVQGGMALGGYNPALYDQAAAAMQAKTAAEQAAASTTPLYDTSSTGLAEGGMVHGGLMFGMNPPGPDDGAVNLQKGEYVVKKSSVDKYGKGLLDMINEGKAPAKKMKSLLG
jgi:hypothetical protein